MRSIGGAATDSDKLRRGIVGCLQGALCWPSLLQALMLKTLQGLLGCRQLVVCTTHVSNSSSGKRW